MKKLGWYIGSALLVLMLGGGLLLLAANLYVQSKGAQQQIRRALSASLGMPATLTKTTVTPWEGLRIDGITLQPDTVNGQSLPSAVITADSFRVRFGLWQLLQRHFVVTEVLLDRPQFVWAQDAHGRWRFPPPNENASSDEASPTAIPSETPDPTTAPQQAEASPTPKPARASKPPILAEWESRLPQFSIDVDKFRVRHGAVDFRDRKGAPIGNFEEVDMDGHLRGARSANGAVWFEKATLAQPALTLSKFTSRFDYEEGGDFTISDGKGEVGGGQLSVDYTLRAGQAGSPFTAHCRFDDVALDHVAPALDGMVRGRLQGNLQLAGTMGDPASERGEGHFSLQGGELKEAPLLKTLGDALRIEDLSHTQLKTAQLDCRIEGNQVFVDLLNLVSNDIHIVAHGAYDAQLNRLDLKARLIIDQAIGHQLPQFIESNFTPGGDDLPAGSRYIDFTVTGPPDKPSSNLLERALTGPMGNFFQNMLAPKAKVKKPKKASPPPEDAAASPAPL